MLVKRIIKEYLVNLYNAYPKTLFCTKDLLLDRALSYVGLTLTLRERSTSRVSLVIVD